MQELYDAGFHKPRIYGRGGVWANAWDVVFAHCLEVVPVARLVRLTWCVLGGAVFLSVFFSWVCISKFAHPEQSASTR